VGRRRISVQIALGLLIAVLAASACAGSAAPEERMSGAVSVSANQRHACGLAEDGSISCWGANLYGQLGDGSTDDADVASSPVQGLADATALSAGDDFSCAVIDDGTVRCWGFNLSGQIGDGTILNIAMESREVLGLDSATGVAAGGNHACALLEETTVRCWGGNEFGQLGDGSTVDRLEPVEVDGLSDVVLLSAGRGFTCALVRDGSVSCWGLNGLGQLGDDGGDRARPGPVPGLADVASIASGLLGTCAVTTDAAVVCWGTAGPEALERSVDDGPAPVDGLPAAQQVAVGDRGSCSSASEGAVSCWRSGSLGSSPPQPVDGATPAAAPSTLAMWGHRVCVVTDDGTVSCEDAP
jgi:alpha-tubulin suppressor-like RCC1 family protein